VCLRPRSRRPHELTRPEVDELQGGVSYNHIWVVSILKVLVLRFSHLEHDIIRLEVPMNNVLPVHIPDDVNQLTQDVDDSSFGQDSMEVPLLEVEQVDLTVLYFYN
jgi:hypothetical protein